MNHKREISTTIIVLTVLIFAISGIASNRSQRAEQQIPLSDYDSTSSNDSVSSDSAEFYTAELIKIDGEDEKPYICTDEYIIEDLLHLIRTASPTDICSEDILSTDDVYYSISLRCCSDDEEMLFGYVVFIDSDKCYLVVPDQQVYSADIDLYFIIGDLVAED